jgi:hypothetical protein
MRIGLLTSIRECGCITGTTIIAALWTLSGPSRRSRTTKIKEGWVLVYELMSLYHNAAIAEAGDDSSSIRKPYVIDDEFFIA